MKMRGNESPASFSLSVTIMMVPIKSLDFIAHKTLENMLKAAAVTPQNVDIFRGYSHCCETIHETK